MRKFIFLALIIATLSAGAQKPTPKTQPKPAEPTKAQEVSPQEEPPTEPSTVESVQPEYAAPEEKAPEVSIESDVHRGDDDGDKSHVRLVPFYYPDKPQLQGKTRKGENVYKIKTSPQKEGSTFRVTPFRPQNLSGDTPGITFDNVYGDRNPVMIGFDYEYQFFKAAGKLGIRPGLGLVIASGNGRFTNAPGTQAREVVNLFLFDFNLGLVYRAQFFDKQILVPYGGVGADYFVVSEYRGDKKNFSNAFKYGGATATHWVAGAQFQLDYFDREGLWQLDQEYGINHLYLFGGVRQTIGLTSKLDVSNFAYEGGLFLEF